MRDLELIKSLPPLPTRATDAHKGTFGTVIVVGGCGTMIGAPALCATSALRSGAGLAKVAVPASIVQAVITIEPSATGIALGNDAESAIALLDHADPDQRAVLAVGPGWGTEESRRAMLELILSGQRSIVLDADGLTMLAHIWPTSRHKDCSLIMTPHPGEYRRLATIAGLEHDPTNPQARPNAAAALAEACHAIVLLKGHQSVVSDGTRYTINHTGNPALATAGSGDVLTGAIAGLWAQGMATFDAAVLGVHLHGLAADLWTHQHGTSGLTAADLAALLPEAFEHYRQNHDAAET